MAYATTNPPICIVPRIGSGPALWLYSDTDVITDVDDSGYFTNGEALGMVVGDVVIVVDTTNGYVYLTYVSTVSTTATITTDVTIN